MSSLSRKNLPQLSVASSNIEDIMSRAYDSFEIQLNSLQFLYSKPGTASKWAVCLVFSWCSAGCCWRGRMFLYFKCSSPHAQKTPTHFGKLTFKGALMLLLKMQHRSLNKLTLTFEEAVMCVQLIQSGTIFSSVWQAATGKWPESRSSHRSTSWSRWTWKSSSAEPWWSQTLAWQSKILWGSFPSRCFYFL